MLPYKEYLILSHCPYCERDFFIIVNNLNDKMIYRCSDCLRGLTIITLPDMKAIVEPGTQNPITINVSRIDKGCCGD